MAEGIELAKLSNGKVERLLDGRKMLAIVRKNWLVLKGDRVRMVPLLLFPIIMIVLFGYAAGNLPKHIPAAVIDYDQTGFSRSVQDELAGVEMFSLKYALSTQDEGKRLLDEGKVKVLFILPEGLEGKVGNGEPAEIRLMVDESDSSVAQVAKSSAQAFALQLSRKAVAGRLSAIAAGAKSAGSALAQAQSALALSNSGAEAISDAGSARMADASLKYAASSELIEDTVLGLQNSLGYLIDQNEIADSYSTATSGQAALTALASGDTQQAVLLQIAVYQAIYSHQAAIYGNAALIYSGAKQLAASAQGQEASASASASLMGRAQEGIGRILGATGNAQNPISIALVEPYGYGRRGIDFLLPNILALIIFQGATMGLGRAIAGERNDGSLTRVFLTPTSNVTIIFGTQLFYLLLETVRSSFIILVAIALFGVSISGSLLDIMLVIAMFAFGSTGVGMVLSVITHTQEQYMAIGMLISLPIMFLSGVFFPVQTLPPFLQSFAGMLPVTYAADAMRGVMVKGFALYGVMPDLLALAAFGAITLTLSLLLFKRELV